MSPRLFTMLVMVGGMAGCAAPLGRLPLTPCHLDGLSEEVLCGTERVPEDRAVPQGATIDIHVAVLPALRREAAPDPLFILAGGPGQGARSYAPVVARAFADVRRTRDIVLVDLRGTGASNPLRCPEDPDPLTPLITPLDHARDAARCLAHLDPDPRLYTHVHALADLDQVRARLGYDDVNLWGGSWGTRSALLYALAYPASVRRVVLDGAVPLSQHFPEAVVPLTERAWSLLVDSCLADAGCRQTHSTIRADVARVLAQLRGAPARVAVDHPITGKRVQATLTADGVSEMMRSAMYTPADATRLFQAVTHAANGDFGPLLAQALRVAASSTDTMAAGQTMSILCSEDVPAPGHLRQVDQTSTLGSGYVDAWVARCAAWPRGDRVAVEDDATSRAPALILSGHHDPVTPPGSGEAMGRHFPSHRHLVVPGAAHNTSFRGCVPKLIAEFLDGADPAALDSACVERSQWPGFVLRDTGGL